MTTTKTRSKCDCTSERILCFSICIQDYPIQTPVAKVKEEEDDSASTIM